MSTTYYIKDKKGRYVSVGYNAPNMGDGLYFRQHDKNSTRTTSVAYWVGTGPQEPVDVNRLISLMKLDEGLAGWLNKIQDQNSPEYKQLEADSGGYVKVAPKIYNISMQDLAAGMLRWLYEHEGTHDGAKSRKTRRPPL